MNLFRSLMILFLVIITLSVKADESLHDSFSILNNDKVNIYDALISILKKRDPDHANDMQLVINDFNKTHVYCKQPNIILSPDSPMWGYINAYVICDHNRQLIQFNLHVYGKYLIASKYIAPGKKISLDDIRIVEGELDTLSSNICLNTKQVLNQVAIRNIQPNEPILHSMLHKPWLIRMYQRVSILATGNGFIVRSEGKALNNAFSNDTINVSMDNGTIVTGRVNPNGEILVSY
ncbi:MAG: flagellar basal body P-ring formation chaperone FlgA [Buchnera aphidicola (Eriosoma harunire)]